VCDKQIAQLRDGILTRFVDSGGDGSTIILVHGLANSLEIWNRVFEKLAMRFRVIAFDLPGFGEASRPDTVYDGAFFGAQIAAFIDRLGIETAHFVGYSLGASAILHFSKYNSDSIDRAVLAAPGGFGRRVHPLMMLPALPVIGRYLGKPTPMNNRMTLHIAIHRRENITPELIELTNKYAAVPGSDMSFHRSLVSGVGPLGARGLGETAELARSFSRTVLVMWGKCDRVFPPSNAKRAMALLPQSNLLMLDDSGHYPHWEQPEKFANAAEEFLI
jgi:pimeloyl-ACP methyl ester carboxylesterase